MTPAPSGSVRHVPAADDPGREAVLRVVVDSRLGPVDHRRLVHGGHRDGHGERCPISGSTSSVLGGPHDHVVDVVLAAVRWRLEVRLGSAKLSTPNSLLIAKKPLSIRAEQLHPRCCAPLRDRSRSSGRSMRAVPSFSAWSHGRCLSHDHPARSFTLVHGHRHHDVVVDHRVFVVAGVLRVADIHDSRRGWPRSLVVEGLPRQQLACVLS